jgi:F5/8 type C domain/Putative Ig domain
VNIRTLLRRSHRRRAWLTRASTAPPRRTVSLLAIVVLVMSALVSGISLTVPNAKAATCGTTNVALNKTATASSTENAGTPAADAVDGNTGTRWSSAFSDPQWLEVDLGSSQSICQVGLNWETAYATGFQIQVSTDNSTWTSIYSTTTGTGGNQSLTVSGTGRYIRMYGTARATQYGYSLWEFQVYTTSGGSTCGTTDAALNKPTTASSLESAGFTAAAATDGNTGTRWSSAFSDPQWLDVDLGSTQAICGVSINWEAAYATAFQIQVSNDNSTWTSVYSTTTGTGGTQNLTVSGSGRYIRMYGTARATQYGYSIWEFDVYTGTGGGTGNTVTVSTPASQTSTVGTAASLQIAASDSASGQTLTYSATGLPAGLSISSTSGLISGTPTTAGTGTVTATATDGTGAHGSASFSWTVNSQVTGCTGQSNQPNFGPNVVIYNPSESATTINNSLNTIFNTQKLNQFGTQRYAELFDPGTYTGVEDNVGYYTSVQGLGQNPDDVTINGDVTVDSFDGTGNATQNFWRSVENLAITPSAGSDRWAVAQAGPFRRVDVHGGLELYPASYGYASGGYIADSKVSGQVASASEQQWYSQDSNFGSWNGSVWNMVFSGVTGAPAQSFPSPPMTTLATTPVSRDVPYLYVDSSGNYHVFEPSLRTNASGPSWANGPTPGTSVPMSQFFVATPSNTAAQINSALAEGCNLFFTPGVYNINQTLNVTNPNTVVLGIGMPTLIPIGGVDTMHVADVDGVRIDGLLFDAGTTNSNALLTVGTTGSTVSHASNPISVQDVFFRIGGDIAGQATNSLVVNANNTLVNDIWAWRADHGNSGTVGWTVNTAQHGVVVNGNNVLATGLFVEHYQNYDLQWLGNGGETIFFQNEMPYDPPNQAAWMNGSSDGYAAYEVGPNVTTHQAYGLGSYCYFNVNPAVVADHAFEAPNTPGVQFHDILTVSLGGVGVINHVINSTGGATPSNTTPVDVTSYP